MDTYGRIEQLLKKNRISAYKLSQETGISTGLLSQWKKRTQTPSTEKLKSVASYFNVSVDFLLGQTDDPSPRATWETVLNALPTWGDVCASYISWERLYNSTEGELYALASEALDYFKSIPDDAAFPPEFEAEISNKLENFNKINPGFWEMPKGKLTKLVIVVAITGILGWISSNSPAFSIWAEPLRSIIVPLVTYVDAAKIKKPATGEGDGLTDKQLVLRDAIVDLDDADLQKQAIDFVEYLKSKRKP